MAIKVAIAATIQPLFDKSAGVGKTRIPIKKSIPIQKPFF